jgi:predicted Zn-dependent protease
MRIKPGEIPPTAVPPTDLKVAAEGYVAAHLNENNYREIKSGSNVRRVNNVVERLSRAAGYPPRTFPVHLVDAGTEVNAAAFNGASIVVYQELLRKVPDDPQLATVLAHEIGHIVAKHYADEAEEQSRAQAVKVGSSVLGSIASIAASAAGYGGASDIAGSVTESATGAVGYGAFVGSFSRTQEYEADHLGLMIMAKAGYNPQSAIEFWGNAESIFGSADSSMGAFFSTHPASGDRMSELNKALPLAMQYYSPQPGTGSGKAVAKKAQK